MRGLVVLLLASLAGASPGRSVELVADTEVSDTGYYQLSWTGTGETATVTLQEAAAADFSDARVIYQGAEAATVVSGRLDGTYHYRIRAGEGPWSATITVDVRHHSLAQAFAFLAVGALVFVATAALIITGHRRHRQEMAGRGEEGGEGDGA